MYLPGNILVGAFAHIQRPLLFRLMAPAQNTCVQPACPMEAAAPTTGGYTYLRSEGEVSLGGRGKFTGQSSSSGAVGGGRNARGFDRPVES